MSSLSKFVWVLNVTLKVRASEERKRERIDKNDYALLNENVGVFFSGKHYFRMHKHQIGIWGMLGVFLREYTKSFQYINSDFIQSNASW